jgi:UDP-3-O-[3-hydroxymyristoyl] glucosamine N-acyltransferase
VPVVALREIAEQLGGELIGDAALRINAIGPLDSATPSTISFLANPRLRTQLSATQAGCVIVGPPDREAAKARGAAIVTADPYYYYARLTQWWARRLRPPTTPTIHPSAVIASGAEISPDATIGALAVVEADAVVGAGAEIGPHCVLGAGAQVGAGTRLAARVTIGAGCWIGERCIVHSGAVIGADGFGFAPFEGRWEKIEQFGSVRIGNDVEIGANTCIDRGALDDTTIGDGVKLDNLIQIGHNVEIGAHTAMAGCVGVAGSTVIGAHCTIGGAAMVIGHVRLADHVNISAGTFVMRSIDKPGVYSGIFPIDENATWEKNAATLRQLHSLRDRIRQLEKNATGSATT